MARKRIAALIAILIALSAPLSAHAATSTVQSLSEEQPAAQTAVPGVEVDEYELPLAVPTTALSPTLAPSEAPTEAPTQAPTEAPVRIDYPVITKIENQSSAVKVTWKSYGSNNSYRIYYRKAKTDTGTWNSKYSGTSWTRLADVKGTSYTHKNLADGALGIYTVRCVNSKGSFTSQYNSTGWENRYFAPPVISSLKSTSSGVKISWKRAKYAENYAVYRKDGSTWKRLNVTGGSDYTDSSVTSGKKYTYTLRMISADNKTFLSSYNSGKSITYTAAPKIKSAANTKTGAKLSWSAVAGATYYRLYYRGNKGWTQLATTKSTSYTDTAVKDAQTKEYTAVCLDSSQKVVSGYYANGFTNTYYKPPVIQKLSNAAGGVKLTWVRPTGAQEYRIYRKDGGSWKRLDQVNGSEYIDATAVSGKSNTYTIRMVKAGSNTFMSDYPDGKSIFYVAAPTVKSFTDHTGGVKLTWAPSAGAYSYCVYYYNGTGWTRIAKTEGTSYNDTSVKEGQTRKYTLRCINKSGSFVSDFYRSGFDHTYSLAPVMQAVSYDNGRYTLRWAKISGAAAYRIYRKNAGDKDWTTIADRYVGTEFTDETLQEDAICAYTLRAQDASGKILGGFCSNPFYLNGEIVDGTIRLNDTYYHFRGGELFNGYVRDVGTMYYYKNSVRVDQSWYRRQVFSRAYSRSNWLYDLMAYTGTAPNVDITDDAAIYALAAQCGIIGDYTEEEFALPADRLFVAQSLVKALRYPQRSVGAVSDSDDPSLLTAAYYGYFIPDSEMHLFPEAEVTEEEFDFLISELCLYQKLKGKTLVVFGDSIMEGQGNLVNGKSENVAALLGTKYGMKYVSYAIPGAVMGLAENKSHIADQVQKAIDIGQKADLIVFNGGTNDTWQEGIDLGSITEGYDMSAIAEDNYSNGFEKAVWLMQQKWSSVPMIYVRSHMMNLGSYSAQQSFGVRGLALAEKWGAGGVDLYPDTHDEAIIDNVERYAYDGAGKTNKGIHPNALGYAKYYLSPIGEMIALAFGE